MLAVIGTICSWVISFLPIIWWIASKGFPKIIPAIMAMMGKGGVIAAILGAIVGIYKWVKHLSIVLLAIKLGSGPLGKIFSAIKWILNFAFKFPVIMGITLVGSQIFPGLLERIFLLVGAVSIKIGLVLFGNVMKLINNSAENNTGLLNTVIGESADQLPPPEMPARSPTSGIWHWHWRMARPTTSTSIIWSATVSVQTSVLPPTSSLPTRT